MNVEDLLVQSQTARKSYTADHVIAVLDGGAVSPARTTMTASYMTGTVAPTVYYTALYMDGSLLTERTASGVNQSPCGDYTYTQDVSTIDSPREFVAVWDEGDPDIFVLERIVL